MIDSVKAGILLVVAAAVFFSGAGTVTAQDGASEELIFGVKLRFGARYDDVRMCVASDPGTKGGPAADISFFTEFGVSEDWMIHVDLPVFRPIFFAAAFDMLQYEPTVSATTRIRTDGAVDVVLGPTLGLSLHYGPDYRSAESGEGRGPSFFALGPMFGGYLGLDFKRPGEAFNVQVGLSPYVTPLFSIDDPDEHQGVVVGGLVDAAFRWN
jgi:hypothetical protein